MALHDDIRIEIEAGNVPEKFRVSDLMNNPIAGPGDMFRLGEGSYALNYLKTEPANKCPNGYHVRVLGQTPRYERVERGLYRLIER